MLGSGFSFKTIPLVCVALLFLSQANAGGSIAFDEVLKSIAGQSLKLMSEVHSELKKTNKTVDQITCSGSRLGLHWKFLSGSRVPAFECNFGSKTLTIESEVRYYDDTGKEGGDPDIAAYYSLANPKWKWN